MSRGRASREGMALLTVLLLVAVMAVVAVAILDDVRFSVRRTTNAETQAQAQWYAAGAESLARRQIADLLKADAARTPLEPRWNGRVMEFPVEEGAIRAVVTDGQNCFNLNSLVYGQGEDLFARPEGTTQFIALGTALGLSRARMASAAAALTDWMDNDAEASAGGAEDARYAGLATPYRTGGVMLADVSEMRAVAGVDADLYRRLRPYVCALPTTAQARLNPNTLTEAQAPLLVMLAQGAVGLQTARAAVAARPVSGWSSADAFWAQPALDDFTPDEETQGQVSLLTRYFDLRVDIDYGGAHAVRTALLYAAPDGAVRTVIRRWTPEE
ncbi:type II secretion system minor pseudopilin GspK [Brevundimonas sp. SL130]|uniref:type II secretion system minor pseudopilin GspK n=1 Tax=Brevundimonas sp. SL130 TaxID=2995143 RepID=UPI00226CC0E1|nr:type II secretion system minor pseudopilin GspK [Brevundimonas sp. SL130]WAC61438.1 type II secretion system minor pseudopilin GspK [Brevundimonas sp. SL130]